MKTELHAYGKRQQLKSSFYATVQPSNIDNPITFNALIGEFLQRSL